LKRGAVLAVVVAVGIGMLAYLTPRANPAIQWAIRSDREMSQVKAREISGAFGVDTSGWTAIVTGRTDSERGRFSASHPNIPEARRFSAVYPRVALASPNGTEHIVVSLSASGDVNIWERKINQKARGVDEAAARSLASSALNWIVGKDAALFRPVPGPPEKEGTLVIAFERREPVEERFEATVNGAALVKTELIPLYIHRREVVALPNRASQKSPIQVSVSVDDDQRGRSKAVDWLSGAAAIAIDFLGTVFATGVYVFWAVRRAIRHRFVFAVSATCLLWGAIYWSNWMGYDERFNTISKGDTFLANFGEASVGLVFLFLLYIILVGATDAIGLRPKLATLRSVFRTTALNRQAGLSVWAGALCAPLLAAVPVAVASLHLFGSQQSGGYDASMAFAAHPALQALDVLLAPALIGLFGFGAPQLQRFIRKGWVCTAILTVCGTLLLATTAVTSESHAMAFLLTGALQFVVYYLLFARLDLLAVLSAGWCAQVLWNASTLLVQPAASLHTNGILAIAILGALTGCVGLVALRGRHLELDESAAPAAVTSQREALMKEFSIAHRVQQEMLPEHPPEIPGCSVSASCQPAQEVGGDLFDFLQLPDGRWTIGVGDVSGKGVPAALYMTLTKGLLMATTQDSSDLVDIIGNVNRHVHAATERKTFVTMALGAFDPETRTFDHVRAGHNPVVWRNTADGATSLLNAPGLGLGIVSDKLFRRSIKLQRVQLHAGDALVFYSDGLTEAMNAAKEQFGEERLMRSVEEADGRDASGVREHLVDSVKQFLKGTPPQDDLTIVVLRVN
jgi:serine phosphatase RsbU (regulator of sigma subunit)